jgi:hypothetical protein
MTDAAGRDGSNSRKGHRSKTVLMAEWQNRPLDPARLPLAAIASVGDGVRRAADCCNGATSSTYQLAGIAACGLAAVTEDRWPQCRDASEREIWWATSNGGEEHCEASGTARRNRFRPATRTRRGRTGPCACDRNSARRFDSARHGDFASW